MIKDITSLEEFRKISGMTTRCYNICVSAGINTFGEFMDYIFTMNCRNMGKNTFQEIISLKSKYKELRMTDSECDIDWEQRRYEIAKTMMHAIYLDDGNAARSDKSGFDFEYKDLQGSAKEAVRFADALIAELKKGGEK